MKNICEIRTTSEIDGDANDSRIQVNIGIDTNTAPYQTNINTSLSGSTISQHMVKINIFIIFVWNIILLSINHIYSFAQWPNVCVWKKCWFDSLQSILWCEWDFFETQMPPFLRSLVEYIRADVFSLLRAPKVEKSNEFNSLCVRLHKSLSPRSAFLLFDFLPYKSKIDLNFLFWCLFKRVVTTIDVKLPSTCYTPVFNAHWRSKATLIFYS